MKHLSALIFILILIQFSACNKKEQQPTTSSENSRPLPIVSKAEIAFTNFNAVAITAEVISEGDAPVTSRGICWDTVGRPKINASTPAVGSGLGKFSSEINGLKSGRTYYIRTYATNSVTTSYGPELKVTTLSKWEQMNPGTTINNLFSDNSSLYATDVKGVLRSNDDGATWNYITENLQISTFSTVFFHAGTTMIFSQPNIYRSMNQGQNWESLITGLPPVTIKCAVSKDNLIICGSYLEGVFISGNNGDSWQIKKTGIPGNSYFFTLHVHEGKIFAGTNNGILISSDNGETWSLKNQGIPNTIQPTCFVSSGHRIYAGMGNYGGLYYSDDNGETWNFQINFSNMNINYMKNFNNSIFVATFSKGLFLFADPFQPEPANLGITNPYNGNYLMTLKGNHLFVVNSGYGGSIYRLKVN